MTENTQAALAVLQTHPGGWLEPWVVAKVGRLTAAQARTALRDLRALGLAQRQQRKKKVVVYRLASR